MTCPRCGGSCVLFLKDPAGYDIPLPCPECTGSGQVSYLPQDTLIETADGVVFSRRELDALAAFKARFQENMREESDHAS